MVETDREFCQCNRQAIKPTKESQTAVKTTKQMPTIVPVQPMPEPQSNSTAISVTNPVASLPAQSTSQVVKRPIRFQDRSILTDVNHHLWSINLCADRS